eukprot:7747375-Pyramimonas_sp.AAC.1
MEAFLAAKETRGERTLAAATRRRALEHRQRQGAARRGAGAARQLRLRLQQEVGHGKPFRPLHHVAL